MLSFWWKNKVLTFFLVFGLSLSMYGTTYMTSGLRLYLDVSKQWSGYNYFSAYFIGASGNTEIKLSKVAGENFLWEVVVPGIRTTYTDVIFKVYGSESNQSSQLFPIQMTNTMNWNGKKNLCLIVCDTCEKNAIGEWMYFISLPDNNPKEFLADSFIQLEFCQDESFDITVIPPMSQDEYISYQWFTYEKGKWERIVNESIELRQQHNNNDSTEGYFAFITKTLINGKVKNWNFELGNDGTFRSAYTYVPNSANAIWPEGKYAITKNIKTVHSNAPDIYDHTTGRGFLMAINGSSRPNTLVWSYDISNLTPNTDYAFTAWITAWCEENMAQLNFTINGDIQGGLFEPTNKLGEWMQVFTIWNSDSATTAKINLNNQCIAPSGNDFAIDDINFYDIKTTTYLYHYTTMNKQEISNDTTIPDTSLPLLWHNQSISEDGHYYDTIRNKAGCDSIIFDLNVTITHIPPCPDAKIVLQDTSISDTLLPLLWYNQSISEDGDYYHTIKDKRSCDSLLLILNVTITHIPPCPDAKIVHQDTSISDTVLPLLWHNLSISEDGHYYDTIRNEIGCDSIIFDLNLTITHIPPCPDAKIVHQDTFIHDALLPLLWYNQSISKDNIYYHIIKSKRSCDSVILVLNVTIIHTPPCPKIKIISNDTIIPDTLLPLLWHNLSISEEGHYYDTIRNKIGCDSIIFDLNLTIAHIPPCPNIVTINMDTVVCDTMIPVLWNNKLISTDGIYYDTITNEQGCSIIVYALNVSINHCLSPCPKPIIIKNDTSVCDSIEKYFWNNKSITQNGCYYDTIRDTQNCDSIICELKVNFIPCEEECVNDIVYQKWKDVLFVDNHNDFFISYQWYENGHPIPNANRQYLYLENGLQDNFYFVKCWCVDGKVINSCAVSQNSVVASTAGTEKKFLKEGNLYIYVNGKIYNLLGITHE